MTVIKYRACLSATSRYRCSQSIGKMNRSSLYGSFSLSKKFVQYLSFVVSIVLVLPCYIYVLQLCWHSFVRLTLSKPRTRRRSSPTNSMSRPRLKDICHRPGRSTLATAVRPADSLCFASWLSLPQSLLDYYLTSRIQRHPTAPCPIS